MGTLECTPGSCATPLHEAGAMSCVEVLGCLLLTGFPEPTAQGMLTCHPGLPGDATLISVI